MENNGMEERNVLSAEEVDALIKASQTSDTSEDGLDGEQSDTSAINTSALNLIIENTRAEFENKLTVLLRKKITVKSKPTVTTNMAECAKNVDAKLTYSVFKIMPYESEVLVTTPHLFQDAAINLLYGGKIQQNQAEPTPLGKIGLITAERICQILLECVIGCTRERGSLTLEHHKTATILSNVSSLPETENVLATDFTIIIEEFESALTIHLTEEFLIKLLPVKIGSGKHKERDFWRTAIKGEVVDSYVTISANIADVKIKVKDFMNMKEGDELTISDPTLVYICLNNLKLFRGLAGQSNSKIVAKVVAQV